MERRHTLVFYDGHCGICHRAVLFALRRDREGSRFRFAPLQGETLHQELSIDTIGELTDSIVVLTPAGQALQESDAVVLMLKQIGGGWRALGHISSWVPRSLRDIAYRGVARVRHRLFKTPSDLCPVIPENLRARFLA